MHFCRYYPIQYNPPCHRSWRWALGHSLWCAWSPAATTSRADLLNGTRVTHYGVPSTYGESPGHGAARCLDDTLVVDEAMVHAVDCPWYQRALSGHHGVSTRTLPKVSPLPTHS